jgi:hypothetical protein
MPDADVAITAGSGTKIDTRTVGAGVDEHRQVVVIGDPDTAGNVGAVDSAGRIVVTPRIDRQVLTATSAGLTNAAYALGDQMGNLYTLTNAARVSGGSGAIVGVSIVDAIDNLGAVDIQFFDRSVTLAADNAPYAISDADALFTIGQPIPLQSVDMGGNRNVGIMNIYVPYICNATSLFAAVIARTANGAIATATSHTLRVYVERD